MIRTHHVGTTSVACTRALLRGMSCSADDTQQRVRERLARQHRNLTGVCLRGTNAIVSSSKALWHFMQGHLLETFVLLSRLGLYQRAMQLAFADVGRWSEQHPFWRFYRALHDAPVRFVPGCSGLSSEEWMVLDFPAFTNRSLLSACRWLPALRRAALSMRQIRVPEGRRRVPEGRRRLVFLRRHTSRPRIANADEIATSLAQWAASNSHDFVDASPYQWDALKQVDELLRADVLVSVHGSGVGSGHFWMREGAVIVELVPSGWWYCVFAYCGAVSGKSWLLSSAPNSSLAGISRGDIRTGIQLKSLVTVPDSSRIQAAVWPSPKLAPRRAILSSALLEHLAMATGTAGATRHHCRGKRGHGRACAAACDGTAVQFWDSSANKARA